MVRSTVLDDAATLGGAPRARSELAPTAGRASSGCEDTRRQATTIRPRLRLIGGFELSLDDAVVGVPLSAQRLLAFLGLAQLPLQRGYIAGTLWPEKSEERAAANLRAALWRVRQPGTDLVAAVGSGLALSAKVDVDVRLLMAERAHQVDQAAPNGELLPDWYDDWVLLERERVRHAQLRALERACYELAGRAEYPRAVAAGLRLVAAEPLRESSHRALVAAHLAEGNIGEAVRQFDACAALLDAELGVDPSPVFVAMCPVFARRLRSRDNHLEGSHG